MRPAKLLAVFCISLTGLLGCRSDPTTAALTAPETRRAARELQARTLDPAKAALRRSLSVDKPQVLALSGGGQWGAFGAGFLKGWTAKGNRPAAFEVVTGTSTGSLIATFAFLGPDYDDTVGKAYLSIRGDQDVMDKRFLITAFFKDALATTGPLRRLIEGVITDEVIRKVAAEGARGRKLYVGAADLDGGVFKPFDLTEIASRHATDLQGARRAYVDALMASAAIPVAFPPVDIDGRTYVDGGIRRNVFLELIVDQAEAVRRERGLERAQPTVYCLVNGSLDVGTAVVKRRVLDIARRSVDVLLDESTDGNLLRIYLKAQKAGLTFRMTRVPPGMCRIETTGENQFDPRVMGCLHTEAQTFAQRDDAWSSEPPLDDGVS